MVAAGAVLKRKEKPPRPPLRLWLSAGALALSGGFHFGYNLVLTNSAELAFKDFVNSSIAASNGEGEDDVSLSTRWSLYVSLLYFGSLVGAFVIRPLADKLGRKRTVLMCASGQAIAVCLSIVSFLLHSHILYAISRFILGFFQSITVGVAPMYMSESSPPACRGKISLSTGLSVQIAVVLSSILANPQHFGTPSTWWVLYAVELCVFAVALVGVSMLPESPSYLITRGDREGAARSFAFFHGISGLDLDVAVETMALANAHASKSVGLLGLIRDAAHRGRAFTGAVVMFAVVNGGTVVITGYAFNIFVTVGLERNVAGWAIIGMSSLLVVGTGLSSIVVDRFGRRPLLLITLSALLVLNCLIAILMYMFEVYKMYIFGNLLIAVMCLHNFVFSAGPSPLSFFIASELCPHHVRGAAMTCCAVIMAGSRAIILAVYPPLAARIHSAQTYGLMFIPSTLICTLYLYKKFPETKAPKAVPRKEEEANVE